MVTEEQHACLLELGDELPMVQLDGADFGHHYHPVSPDTTDPLRPPSDRVHASTTRGLDPLAIRTRCEKRD
jgi:hypothetical protein